MGIGGLLECVRGRDDDEKDRRAPSPPRPSEPKDVLREEALPTEAARSPDGREVSHPGLTGKLGCNGRGFLDSVTGVEGSTSRRLPAAAFDGTWGVPFSSSSSGFDFFPAVDSRSRPDRLSSDPDPAFDPPLPLVSVLALLRTLDPSLLPPEAIELSE